MTGEQILRLTRLRDPEARGETWHIWYDDVRVWTIAETSGGRQLRRLVFPLRIAAFTLPLARRPAGSR